VAGLDGLEAHAHPARAAWACGVCAQFTHGIGKLATPRLVDGDGTDPFPLFPSETMTLEALRVSCPRSCRSRWGMDAAVTVSN